MDKNTTSNWEVLINKTIRNLMHDFKDKNNITELPKGKISEFSLQQTLEIYTLLEKGGKKELVNTWIEKVRKFIEINRPRLVINSAQRFGGTAKGIDSLEGMGTLMALTAYTKKSIIYYNATCTVWDTLHKSYSDKQLKTKTTLNLIHQVTNNPQYYIGRKHEI